MRQRLLPALLIGLLAIPAWAADGSFRLGWNELPAQFKELAPVPDPGIPADKNAFVWLKRASESMPVKCRDCTDFFMTCSKREITGIVIARAKLLVNRHPASLELWDKAMAAPEYSAPSPDYRLDITFTEEHPRFSMIRELTLANVWRIRIATFEGRHADAFADWNNLRMGLMRIGEKSHRMIERMIFTIMQDVATEEAWRLSPPAGRVESASLVSFDSDSFRNALKEELRAYIGCVPDDASDIPVFRKMWEERLGRKLVKFGNGEASSLTPEELKLAGSEMENRMRDSMKTFGKSSERAKEALDELHRLTRPGFESVAEYRDRSKVVTPMTKRYAKDVDIYEGSLDQSYLLECHRHASDAMATTIAALRAYEVERARLPDSLGSLVPKYISTVPVDPYSGRPLNYDAKRRCVWSVGPDGVDDDAANPGEKPRRFSSKGDLVFVDKTVKSGGVR